MVAPPPTPPTVKPTRPGHGEGPGFSGAMKSFALAGVMPRAPNVEFLSVSVNEEPRFSDPQHIRQFDADTDVLASLCDQSPAIIALISIETGKVVYMNRAGMAAVGLTSPKDVRDVSPAAYLSPATYQAMSTVGLQAALSGEEWIDEGTFLNLVTHTEFDVEIRLFPIIERSSNEIHFLATIARDIAARKQATAQLELSESRFRRLAENIPDIVFRARLTDPPQLEYLNAAVESVLGHTVQDCYDNPKIVFSVIGLDLLEASAPSNDLQVSQIKRGVSEITRADGSATWLETSLSVLGDPDSNANVIEGVIRDVTDSKKHEWELAQRALHDSLTGLANRTQLLDRVEEALADQQPGAEDVALLFIDLDHFKEVNDVMGHEAGDQLLVDVSRRLRSAVRPGDLVARLGGDEFVVLLRGLEDLSIALGVAERVKDAVTNASTADGSHQLVTPSIGIAVSGPNASTAEDLIRNADDAMYTAKNDGRARWRVFDEPLREKALARVAQERLFRNAFQRSELLTNFRPEADVESGRVIGMQALVRWPHPERGLLDYKDFAAIAESTGLVGRIGDRLMTNAMRQLSVWDTEGLPELSLRLSVLGRQLGQVGFPLQLRQALEACDIDPSLLWLDISELTIVRNPDLARLRLRALKDLGVNLAVDEFGRGSSSIRYLRQFPLDAICIDATFAEGLGRADEGEPLAHSLMHFARSSGLNVVATGVGNAHALAFVRELGVVSVIGDFVGEPKSDAAISAQSLREPIIF